MVANTLYYTLNNLWNYPNATRNRFIHLLQTGAVLWPKKKPQTFLVAGMSEATHASASRIEFIGKPSGDFTCTLVSKNVLSSSTRGEGLVDVRSTGPVN